jgi:6-phosphofructokinase 1
MNAVIAGASERVEALGGELIGVRDGFLGLAERRMSRAAAVQAQTHARQSGTWLRTSRWPGLREAAGRQACREAVAALALDGLMVIGGGGSAEGLRALALGVPVAFVPATIDADVGDSETAVGVDSAVAYAVRVIDELRVTGRSLPGRAFVVQTLGAPHGHLAAAVAAASGVEDVLVPERPPDLEEVAARLSERAARGEAIVVMSEAIGDAVAMAATLAARAGLRVHPTILGHAQRAATPSRFDVDAGRAAGAAAVDALATRADAMIALSPTGELLLHPLTP